MIESTKYFAIELFVVALLVGLTTLAVVTFIHGRAGRMATRRHGAVIPLSMKETEANENVLRDDLETNAQLLKTDGSSQLAELDKRGDAINRLKTCLEAVRDQLRATEERLVLKTIATREAERTLTDKESELAKLTTVVDERSALADLQKTEIVTLRMQLQTLQGRLTQAREETKAVEERHNADRREAERALSDKASELGTVTTALNERSILADSQKAKIAALAMKVQALNEQLTQFGEEAMAAEERHDAAVREAERALTDKDVELTKRTSTLSECSVVADSKKAEIEVLTVQVQKLNDRLIQALDETKAVQDCCDAAVRALSEKKSEVTRLTTVLDESSMLDDSQIAEIAALTRQIQTLNEQLTRSGEEAKALEERRDTALPVLSDKESELARMKTALDECSVLAESQKVEYAALTIQVQTLNERFTEAGLEAARALEEHRDAALRTLSEKESELAMLTSTLEQRSALFDAQKVENGALKTQVQALNERLIQAGKEARALEERRTVERNELQAVTENLNDERARLKNFHGRAVSLVQQLTAQRAEDEDLHRRARKDLENRLIEQSRLLNESECELTHLRGEIEIARNAEHDLRITIIEIEGRNNTATQNLIAEKAQLHGAIDRASGERARLAHELSDLRRRQADQAKAAERLDSAPMPERVKDIAAERARRLVGGRLPQIA
jgi:chromosome segregation ATPase